jgi:hypothetical protein
VTAHGRLRSRRDVRRINKITPTAMRVNTTVIDVPMLNAAPLLRSTTRVSTPSMTWTGRRRVATTMILEITSAA